MNIENKINELTGSIKKEQWRMNKEGEICSPKHSMFLDTMCYTLFDIAENINLLNIKQESSVKTTEDIKVPTSIIEETKESSISGTKENNKISKLDRMIKPLSSSVEETENTNKDDIFIQKEDSLSNKEELKESEEKNKELDSEPILKEMNLEEDSCSVDFENHISDSDNTGKSDFVTDFTYCYQKYVLRHEKKAEDIYVCAFPLTTSKEESVSIPIAVSVLYEGHKLDKSSFDDASGNRPAIICDFNNFKIVVVGSVNRNGEFTIHVASQTEGYTLAQITTDAHTNIGNNFNILSDVWQDKTLYGFPVDINNDDYLIISKAEFFFDYTHTESNRAALVIAHDNDDSRENAFVKVINSDDGYEFLIKKIGE